MNNKELYKQTQRIAESIAKSQGYELDANCDSSIFTEHHVSVRVRTFFKVACDVQEDVFGHEISDIIQDVEEVDDE